MKSFILVILIIFIFAPSILTHGHHKYKCVFDQNNQDLTGNAKLSKPTQSIYAHAGGHNKRQLLTLNRSPMRITLDTTDFNTIKAGANGAATTTQTNLNFILSAMSVAQSFYQSRLQVTPVASITSFSPCVDFNPPANDISNGIAASDLHIYVQYLSDKNKAYGATGKSCNYFSGTTTSGGPDTTLQAYRPTVGRIVFNTYTLVENATLTNRLFQSVCSTAIHQTTHILGFDSTLYSKFLDPNTGNPYASTTTASTPLHPSRPASTLLTTPFVTAWAKTFFNCPGITGMQMQNEDGTGLGAGSHWERMVMYDELMTATSFGAQKGYSPLTFAILKDMGWYTVDDTFNDTTNYGYQKGCSFYTDGCYSSTTFPNFCNAATQANMSICETTFWSKSICSNQAAIMADGCGIYGPYFDCVDPSSSDDGYKSYTLESYGTSSFCITGTLSNVPLSPLVQSRCYPYVCNANSVTFTIGTFTITCLSTDAGVNKTLSALNGVLQCPNFQDFCSLSRKVCPNWCSKNGYCMRGKCNCLTGYSGLDCSITTCTSSQFYNPATNACVASCPSGTYGDKYSKTCITCISPCLQCTDEPTICTGCQTTLSNPKYFYNNTCYSTCPSTTYVSGTNCIACDIPSNCKTCSGTATNCLSCYGGLYASAGVCVASCSGTLDKTDVVNNVCTDTCRNNLITVTVGGNPQCQLCSGGTFKYVSGNTCINPCPNNYYPDSVNVLCASCDTSCLNCDGPYAENCTACNSATPLKYLLLKMCWSICPKGFYPSDSAGACNLCTVGLNCASCKVNSSLSVVCTSCSYGYYYQTDGSGCLSSCQTYEYKNTWNHSCNACLNSCGNCNGPSNSSCIDCRASNYFISNISGSYCISSCPAVGYVPSSTNCLPCDITCNTCNGISSSQCSTCNTGYYLYSGYCRYVCPNGTYPNSATKQCNNCDGSCTYCFGSTIDNCTTCVSGLVLYNFTCTSKCPGNLTANQWNVCSEYSLQITFVLLFILIFIVM